MRNLFFKATIGFWLGLMAFQAWGQPHVRSEDHFWRKRVVNRISMVEKINRPLVNHESSFYSGDQQFTETDGIIVSLINGMKQGKYTAYHPDDWGKTLSYEDLIQRMREFEEALIVEEDVWGEEEESFETEKTEGEWEDEWSYDETEQEWGSPFESEPETDEGNNGPAEPDVAPYEEVIHMVEDWIFDKNRSMLVKHIDFFEVIWTDPTGSLPEKVLARFMWKDVQEQLDQTKWKSRFNDSEARSVREVFDLRIFNSILINVGGNPIITLQEAERRRQELIEFEHHLWSY